MGQGCEVPRHVCRAHFVMLGAPELRQRGVGERCLLYAREISMRIQENLMEWD